MNADTCTICGYCIHGTRIGDGDGAGQRFAHPGCYQLRGFVNVLLPLVPADVRTAVAAEAAREGILLNGEPR